MKNSRVFYTDAKDFSNPQAVNSFCIMGYKIQTHIHLKMIDQNLKFQNW